MVIDLKAAPVTQDIDGQRRVEIMKFLSACGGITLVIGEHNEFDNYICRFNCDEYVNTRGDLNWLKWEPWYQGGIFNSVFCFDVIEHLINPGLFLKRLARFITNETNVYITFPYRHNVKYWSSTHFQEYDLDRFKTLVELCGYQIIREQHVILHRPWRFYLGFRPLMRLLFNKYHYNLYLLRLK